MLKTSTSVSIMAGVVCALALCVAAAAGEAAKTPRPVRAEIDVRVDEPISIAAPDEPRVIWLQTVEVFARTPARAVPAKAEPAPACKDWRQVRITGGWVRECG